MTPSFPEFTIPVMEKHPCSPEQVIEIGSKISLGSLVKIMYAPWTESDFD